jgi:hypothetical protein
MRLLPDKNMKRIVLGGLTWGEIDEQTKVRQRSQGKQDRARTYAISRLEVHQEKPRHTVHRHRVEKNYVLQRL